MNYKRLVDAINYYESKGFKYIDVPWVVSSDIINETKPKIAKSFFINKNELVGSAEQSFMQLMQDNKLPFGRYCALTPCFRDERPDDLHANYFMKLELIDTMNVDINSLNNILFIAKDFFDTFLPVDIVFTDKLEYDIVDIKNGIELGSYGIRYWKDKKHVYATGLAEPRLSVVLEKNL